jgi:predicted nucleic acid-binding Zn ribbon protein
MEQVYKPTYAFTVTISDDVLHDGWSALDEKTRCDETLAKLRRVLADAGLTAGVLFQKFR